MSLQKLSKNGKQGAILEVLMTMCLKTFRNIPQMKIISSLYKNPEVV